MLYQVETNVLIILKLIISCFQLVQSLCRYMVYVKVISHTPHRPIASIPVPSAKFLVPFFGLFPIFFHQPEHYRWNFLFWNAKIQQNFKHEILMASFDVILRFVTIHLLMKSLILLLINFFAFHFFSNRRFLR